jgi:predicted CXXCH cytochrome family protein
MTGPKLIVYLVTISLLGLPSLATGKVHPSLVNPATAKCVTCHEAVMSKSVKHPAALDGGCTNCHEFAKAEGKTTVVLSGDEPQLCVTCHDTMSKAAEGTLAAPHAPVTSACTSCHDPHSAAQANVLNDLPPALCLTCHDAADVDKNHKRSVSTSQCLSCHAPHGSENKGMLVAAKEHPPFAERSCDSCHRQGTIARAKPKTNVCFACHDETAFQAKFVHTAVKQGKCTGCHEPHLAARDKFVRADGPALCTGCHAAIKAKIDADGAHAQAKDDCSTCHHPHQSANPAQLNDSVPALCLTCHDASDKELTAKHLQADLTKTDCLTCHDPHGSREKSLLVNGSLHPPFAEKSCNSCHASETAAKFIATTAKELCVACHSDVEETAAKAKFQHAALEAADCTECHTPHASREERLVKLPAGGECTGCHADQAAGKDEYAHGAIGFLGCRACHEPHGGERPRFLRAEGDKLCLGCHEANTRKTGEANTVLLLDHFKLTGEKAAEAGRMTTLAFVGDHIGNHPLAGHRATGKPTDAELKQTSTTFTGELGCLTCHDPHKGRSSNHFRGNAATTADLCLTCHKK